MQRESSPIVLVVSVDGIAPRHIDPDTMPSLVTAARQGSSCFNAETILPSLTLPAHASLLRGVPAQDHGIFDNTPQQIQTEASSFLLKARESGFKTAMLHNWQPFECLVEPQAVEQKFVIDGGHCGSEDDRMTIATVEAIQQRKHNLIFSYLARGDLAGHEHGWDSPGYLESLAEVDRCLSLMIEVLGPQDSLVITTDHGGLGQYHDAGRPEDVQTFVVVKSPQVSAGGFWPTANILDIAPTVATLAGFAPCKAWVGTDLIGKERSVLDWLLGLLAESAHVQYGENLNMLEHALQAAQLAKQEGHDDSMVVACLLHDIGHLLGEAGAWGLPEHADVAALALQQRVNACISQPIKLHVSAKRYLVSTSPDYASDLSKASLESLAEQGGQLSEQECCEFEAQSFARQAVKLRKFDDQGKNTSRNVPPLEHYRDLLAKALQAPIIDPSWARDACRCRECRDPKSGQHLIGSTALIDWSVVGESYDTSTPSVRLRHTSGEEHLCKLTNDATGSDLSPQTWGSEHINKLRRLATAANINLEGLHSPIGRLRHRVDTKRSERGRASIGNCRAAWLRQRNQLRPFVRRVGEG